MPRYRMDFILNIHKDAPPALEVIRNSIIEFGDEVEVLLLAENNDPKSEDLRVRINTQDPILVFDSCLQFGRLRSVKVTEG
ncbi:MAG: hypothetical protein WC510_06625 [Candidatus Omnitrophota bacterium]